MSLDVKLSPTEDLIMEVLYARHRLGERIWPFPNAVRKSAIALVDKGLVYVGAGQTPGYFACSLTVKGERGIDLSYVPPIFKTRSKLENKPLSWQVYDSEGRLVARDIKAHSAIDALGQFAYTNDHWYAVPKRTTL